MNFYSFKFRDSIISNIWRTITAMGSVFFVPALNSDTSGWEPIVCFTSSVNWTFTRFESSNNVRSKNHISGFRKKNSPDLAEKIWTTDWTKIFLGQNFWFRPGNHGSDYLPGWGFNNALTFLILSSWVFFFLFARRFLRADISWSDSAPPRSATQFSVRSLNHFAEWIVNEKAKNYLPEINLISDPLYLPCTASFELILFDGLSRSKLSRRSTESSGSAQNISRIWRLGLGWNRPTRGWTIVLKYFSFVNSGHVAASGIPQLLQITSNWATSVEAWILFYYSSAESNPGTRWYNSSNP